VTEAQADQLIEAVVIAAYVLVFCLGVLAGLKR